MCVCVIIYTQRVQYDLHMMTEREGGWDMTNEEIERVGDYRGQRAEYYNAKGGERAVVANNNNNHIRLYICGHSQINIEP